MDQDPKKNNLNKENKPKKDDDFQWKKVSKSSIIWVALFISALFLANPWEDNNPNEKEVSYSKYLEFLNNNNIEEATVTLKKNLFSGKLKEPIVISREGGNTQIFYFRTTLPFISDEVVKSWEDKNINYSYSFEVNT